MSYAWGYPFARYSSAGLTMLVGHCISVRFVRRILLRWLQWGDQYTVLYRLFDQFMCFSKVEEPAPFTGVIFDPYVPRMVVGDIAFRRYAFEPGNDPQVSNPVPY